jgi:hypothetical protein
VDSGLAIENETSTASREDDDPSGVTSLGSRPSFVQLSLRFLGHMSKQEISRGARRWHLDFVSVDSTWPGCFKSWSWHVHARAKKDGAYLKLCRAIWQLTIGPSLTPYSNTLFIITLHSWFIYRHLKKFNSLCRKNYWHLLYNMVKLFKLS